MGVSTVGYVISLLGPVFLVFVDSQDTKLKKGTRFCSLVHAATATVSQN